MKKLLLSVVMGVVLTACSGGGSGSGSSNNATSSAIKKDTVSVKSIGLVQKDYKQQVMDSKQLEIDGYKLNLADEPIGFVEKNLPDNMKGKAYNQAYSAIGYALPKNVKTDQYGRVIDERVDGTNVRILGLITKYDNLPTKGVLTYEGGSLGAKIEGKLLFNADFDNKQVSGKLYDRKFADSNKKLSDITLDPTSITRYRINDIEAHFGGVAVSSVDGVSVKTGYAGIFMGPNAEEVTGIVIDDRLNPYEGFSGKATKK